MRRIRDTYACPCCDGTGRAPLPPVLQHAMDICRALDGEGIPITSVAVHPRYRGQPQRSGRKPSTTAVCNTLEKLVRLEHLRRLPERDGKRVVYQLTGGTTR